jgi:hypothetical protein
VDIPGDHMRDVMMVSTPFFTGWKVGLFLVCFSVSESSIQSLLKELLCRVGKSTPPRKVSSGLLLGGRRVCRIDRRFFPQGNEALVLISTDSAPGPKRVRERELIATVKNRLVR